MSDHPRELRSFRERVEEAEKVTANIEGHLGTNVINVNH